MSLVQVLSICFALAICAVPVLLLRPGRGRLAADGMDQPVPPAIIRNAWIAYALRLSVFVPLFALGAAGDLWPAIVGTVAFGAGLYLLGMLQSITGFVEKACREGHPATLHAFLAQACGGAAGVRRTTATITVVALLGLAGAEAAALVVVLTPLVGDGVGIPLFVLLVLVAGLYGLGADTKAVRYVSQALLGAIYIGLFGSAAFLLYLTVSDLRPMPEHGAFALVALAACSVAILIYRQTKYVEAPNLVGPEETSRWRRSLARQVRLLLRLANVVISVLAVVVVVFVGMVLYFLGLRATVQNAVAALGMVPHIPAVGFVGIAVLASAYPLVDAVSWRNAGALETSAQAAGPESGTSPASFQRQIRMVAGETAMIGVLLAAFGAIATMSTDLPAESTGMPDLLRQLMVFDIEITDAALTLLLVGLFAMVVSTMGMAASTALTVARLDILPAARPGTIGVASPDRAAAALIAAITVVSGAVWIVSGVPSAGIIGPRFFAVVLAFASLQVALLPLLLARLLGLALSNSGAAAIVLGGCAASLVSIAIHGATADVLWLWLAVPACLLSGFLLLAAIAWHGRPITRPG